MVAQGQPPAAQQRHPVGQGHTAEEFLRVHTLMVQGKRPPAGVDENLSPCSDQRHRQPLGGSG